MPRCRMLTGWIVLLAAAWTGLQAGEPSDRQWRFTVLLDGKPIGHHHVDLAAIGSDIEYRSETRLTVKILFLTAYRYLHVDRELWREDCLTQIESTTDDDGKAQFLRGSLSADSFAITNQNGRREIPATCVMTFAYWNPAILKATRLMNAQTGEYIPVQVKALGPDPVMVSGRRVAAEHYAIAGEKLGIELWYGEQGEWLRLATKTERGGRLEYALE